MRVLLMLKSFSRRGGGPPRSFAGKLRVPPWTVDGYVKQSRRFTEKELKGAMSLLAEADTDLKTGRVPRGLVIPGLIIELCSGSRTPGAGRGG
jgi:DNA polymerase III delta subunit